MLEWNDLRTVLAISRTGTATAAAEVLGVHPSTVFRRLNAMEREMGVQFFQRLPDGYVATAAGEEACAAAERVEAEIAVLGRRLSGRDLRPSGTVRITTTDTLVGVVNEDLAAFRERYPEIDLRVLVTNRFFDLTRHDADIAVRPTSRPPESLVGRRIGNVATVIYASDGYLREHPAEMPWTDHAWVAPDESLGRLSIHRWLETHAAGARVQYRANSLMAVLEAVRSGGGMAALPVFLGDRAEELRRVTGPVPELTTDLWLLTHPDLRAVARVKAVMDWLAGVFARHRSRFEGRSVGADVP